MKTFAYIVLSGTLVLGACASMHASADEEQNETHVQFTELSPAVQKTFAAAAEGQKITTVDVEHGTHGATYEADVMLHGRNYEIRVAPDGKLVSRKIDNEDQPSAREQTDHDQNGKDNDRDND